MTATSAPHAQRFGWVFHPRVRSAAIQLLAVAAIAAAGWYLFQTARQNIAAQGMATGIDFFWVESGFSISQSLIPFSEASSYARAFLVGLLNTLFVSVLGVVFATVIGFLIGIGRLSSNWIVARVCGLYVELIRNLPLLFQILFWYLAVLATLPGPRQSYAIFGEIFINNRGIYVPKPIFGEGIGLVAAAIAIAIVLAIVISTSARRYAIHTGTRLPGIGWLNLGLIAGAAILSWRYLGVTVSIEHPELKGFNFNGGTRVIPEFAALLIALSTYTAAFIAEIVRAGVLAVNRGQTEAALAVGLRRGQLFRFVVIPQALRVIIPPLTSQYLNLFKNSSLAVAIGYPDLVSVFAGTTLNQTGQAIEIIAMTMLVYLVISLIISFAMNLYNRRIAIQER